MPSTKANSQRRPWLPPIYSKTYIDAAMEKVITNNVFDLTDRDKA